MNTMSKVIVIFEKGIEMTTC